MIICYLVALYNHITSHLCHEGAVCLVQAVLGEGEDLLGGAVVGHEVLVLGVLLLAELGRLRDVLVQRHDAGLQRGDLLRLSSI